MSEYQDYSREYYKENGQLEPTVDELRDWDWERGGCYATDGCFVEVDGQCQHGCKSWFREIFSM